jgi:hypothetical protein
MQTVFHGVDSDCLSDAYLKSDELGNSPKRAMLEEATRSQDEAVQLKAWRQQGPIGKLHNLVVHIRHCPSRGHFFESKQHEAAPDRRLYRVILNGGIRWNSTYDMIERGLRLRDAIELYQAHYSCRRDTERLPAENCLRTEDWDELVKLSALLQPIK